MTIYKYLLEYWFKTKQYLEKSKMVLGVAPLKGCDKEWKQSE